MSFSEKVKDEAKRKSHYKCVICHEPFVDVHHIIPQKDDGFDTLENAATLCAGCHGLYGNDPQKQKQIREMRNLWWELCDKVEGGQNIALFRKIDELKEQIQETAKNTKENQIALTELKDTLSFYYRETATQVQSASTLEDVIAASGHGLFYPNEKCKSCGQYVVTLGNKCPSCGKDIR